ncbi:MAG: polyribonucleotide nucleotidyltransferase [Candidatus Pacebacteria bacterium]|jgi:polyribonucleotide nucleotidyltransferase|nr:polyribonucleotide nucleotidyltransferase [Candidatus Paceibacterota bacterium]|tara:strand:+ start:40046 stop:42181 length:2136 start_codon:yes stop_codon:yes gene_type:complete
MQKKEYSIEIGGKTLTVQFTDLADQTNGSVIVRLGNTSVLATVVMSTHKREGIDYFPLTVDYEEKFYAVGQILGSRFLRREGRPSEEAILSGRVVDRTIRPLFDQYIRNEVQVVTTVLSVDKDDPDILAINAASIALAVSDIPWNGPVSAVRIGKHKGENKFEINPHYLFRENKDAELDMIICGRDGDINMIETGAEELSEDILTDAFIIALKEIEKLQEFQKKIVKEIGKEKQKIEKIQMPKEVIELFESSGIKSKLPEEIFSSAGKGKVHALQSDWSELVKEKLSEEQYFLAHNLYEEEIDKLLHREAIENNRRADGRKMDEVRKLFAQAGDISEIIHGSGIFYRGGTHVFSALTLGGPDDSLIIDSIEAQQEKKHFIHHYNFPPFSSGETGRMGGTNRRMIGHGALAEKALTPVIPPKEKFPYTIRVVSESLASNGSTSMASVCASTIALMDGGVPIKAPVAGIAMGLVMDEKETGKYKILTDIQGPEDHHGDMDFKVAGTRQGVTAVQMDVKVGGIPTSILKEALGEAKKARLQILDIIEKEIPTPRAKISQRAPKIVTMKIKKEQIGDVIGSGGKIINEIKDEMKVDDINIEDDGTIFITGKGESTEQAWKAIEEIVHEYKAGERYTGEVMKITDFGAFVKIGRKTEGLVHISEIAPFRVNNVSDILKEGDKVPVAVKGVDEKDRISLSIKAADPNFAKSKTVVKK